MIIIGITGTLGAGKGTIVEYLTEQHNYRHYSVREYITGELTRRNLPENRDTMTETANLLRSVHGPSFIIAELYEQAKRAGENCIIESIRTPGEVELLRGKENFLLIAVDANPETRYQRISLRKSSTDSVSYQTFLENEQREMVSGDPNKQNLSWCIAHADYTFRNDGNKEELFRQIETVIQQIQNK